MTDSLARIKPEDVKDIKSWCDYTHQRLGVPRTPMRTGKGNDIPALTKAVNVFFADYPHADYGTLVKITDFIISRKSRPANMFQALAWYKAAWASGALPECDPREYRDPALEAELEAALVLETHPRWIEQLQNALWVHGDNVRTEVLAQWRDDRNAAGLETPR